MGNACDDKGICTGPDTCFEACDYLGNTLWFDNGTQIIIYNRDSMELERPNALQAIVNFLSNPVRSMINFAKSQLVNPVDVPTEVFEFNRYYRVQVGDKTIVGAVRGKTADDRYIVVSFDNVTSLVCDSIQRYNENINCSGYYIVSDESYSVMNEILPDITARLRLQSSVSPNLISHSFNAGANSVQFQTDVATSASVSYGNSILHLISVQSSGSIGASHDIGMPGVDPANDYYTIKICIPGKRCGNFGPYKITQ